MARSVSLAILLIVFTLAACSSQEGNHSQIDPDTPLVTVNHDLGEVQVPAEPQRVVSLDFGALENLDLINANVVGIPKTGVPHFLSEYDNNTSIANLGSLVEVSLEEINELQPDLIILGGRLSESYDEISQIAPTILPASSTEDPIGALEKNLSTLGRTFNQQEVFDQKMQRVHQKIDSVRSIVDQHADKEALILLHNRGRFSAYGSGSRFGIIHDVLGVKEAAEGLDAHLHGTRVSSEFIQQTNPDIIFVIDRSAAIGEQSLNKSDVENELIRKTNAYENDKIIYLDPDAWYLSAGGGVTSIEIMINEVASAF